jgi:acetyl esterase/lipase
MIGKIGFIGLGIMGTPMSLSRGRPLCAWDHTLPFGEFGPHLSFRLDNTDSGKCAVGSRFNGRAPDTDDQLSTHRRRQGVPCVMVPGRQWHHSMQSLTEFVSNLRSGVHLARLAVSLLLLSSSSLVGAQSSDGTVQLVPESVPFSTFASAQAKQAFIHQLSTSPPKLPDIAAQRAFHDHVSGVESLRMKALYAVHISNLEIGGVRTEVVVPGDGIAPQNKERVLINLHGGSFLWGEGSGGELEAIPIASIGKIKVVTVAYRQGPEYQFPAASEDVASVYRALLREYKPTNIGIYGCSAGGILTAEAVAWFTKVGLPTPGAIGTFCGSAAQIDGDSAYLAPELNRRPGRNMAGAQLSLPYFKNANPDDPMLFPVLSPQVMAKFPPTLLIAGSRDPSLSSLFRTQAELSRLGVDAELHVWDGMWHAFFVNPDLPESKEVYAVVVKFFSEHLGKPTHH